MIGALYVYIVLSAFTLVIGIAYWASTLVWEESHRIATKAIFLCWAWPYIAVLVLLKTNRDWRNE